ncbi:hypothetical protein EW146_g9898 [Bondarzewia mesenterica]|uniref:Uncharacterized protein n=1 Tax=Bondarzewia mesenterica TaxID=1095465 RepID=A0A4S4L3P1_9AGAM|nr:hypothetical protein EW146_g9898 [Bondarzewia mesenterica]
MQSPAFSSQKSTPDLLPTPGPPTQASQPSSPLPILTASPLKSYRLRPRRVMAGQKLQGGKRTTWDTFGKEDKGESEVLLTVEHKDQMDVTVRATGSKPTTSENIGLGPDDEPMMQTRLKTRGRKRPNNDEDKEEQARPLKKARQESKKLARESGRKPTGNGKKI